MKNIIFVLIIFGIFISCDFPQEETRKTNDFEKSFKEQNSESFNEHKDSISNVYSNFKYHIAFDAPDSWNTDAGVSEHTIYRTFQPDSSITFSINVIEIKLNNPEMRIDIWELYQTNKKQFDYQFQTAIENQLNSKMENLVCQKSFLKNNISLKRTYNYKLKDLDYEYYVTNISYQTIIAGFTYTFSLSIPSVFYNQKTEYYDNLFGNIYFLKNRKHLDKILKESKNK